MASPHDLRISRFDAIGTAGVTESWRFVAPAALTSLSVYVGPNGSLSDVDDLTDATEYPATLSTTTVTDDTATAAVYVPTRAEITGSNTPLRLVVDGAVEAVGNLTPSTSGTTTTDDTIELTAGERTFELTVIGQRGPAGPDLSDELAALTDRVASLEATAITIEGA